jgi:aminoglycoside 6'-N-acetyltransferase I
MNIINLAKGSDAQREQAALLLHIEFNQARWNYSWETLDEARAEVAMMCEDEHICRAAVDATGEVFGWTGGLPEYDGNVWELHPMVVRPDQRGKGIGAALVRDLEERVAGRGGLTLTLGTDDTDYMTSLGGADLYTNLQEQVTHIRNFKYHPYEFYQRMGFVITGVVPDANGRGKPDIYMSKRIGSWPDERTSHS